jgi:hypothetical protein
MVEYQSGLALARSTTNDRNGFTLAQQGVANWPYMTRRASPISIALPLNILLRGPLNIYNPVNLKLNDVFEFVHKTLKWSRAFWI